MRIISRQFTKEILLATAFVLVVLVALFAFFDLIAQLDNVGAGRPMSTALKLTALVLPERVYEVMPLAALLAAVYVLSRWAHSSEFTVLRVAGMSSLDMAKVLLIPGIILMLVTYAVGEFAVPAAERAWTEVRTSGANITARGYESGVWIRDVDKSGSGTDRYINVRSLKSSNLAQTGRWRVFEFDMTGRIKYVIEAKSASYDQAKQGWNLRSAVRYTYPIISRDNNRPTSDRVLREPMKTFFFATSVTPDMLGVMTVKPETMSMRDLDTYVNHLKRNNQDTDRYEVTFWNKVFYPLAVLVMLAVAMPFAYVNARSGGVAIKIFAGVIIGVAFYALNNVFSFLGTVNTWSPIVVSVMPSAVMLAAAAVLMRYVEKR